MRRSASPRTDFAKLVLGLYDLRLHRALRQLPGDDQRRRRSRTPELQADAALTSLRQTLRARPPGDPVRDRGGCGAFRAGRADGFAGGSTRSSPAPSEPRRPRGRGRRSATRSPRITARAGLALRAPGSRVGEILPARPAGTVRMRETAELVARLARLEGGRRRATTRRLAHRARPRWPRRAVRPGVDPEGGPAPPAEGRTVKRLGARRGSTRAEGKARKRRLRRQGRRRRWVARRGGRKGSTGCCAPSSLRL